MEDQKRLAEEMKRKQEQGSMQLQGEVQNCGSIYYESKRTKEFQPFWIEKFKTDIREKKANIGILASEVMPSEMDRMGMKEEIWILYF